MVMGGGTAQDCARMIKEGGDGEVVELVEQVVVDGGIEGDKGETGVRSRIRKGCIVSVR